MDRFFKLLFIVVFFLFSENIVSQSVKIEEIKSEKQLISGVTLSPNFNNLQKAVPFKVVQVKKSDQEMEPKKPLKTKPVKVSKYNNNKSKRDEE
jgi:hypothetical protein